MRNAIVKGTIVGIGFIIQISITLLIYLFLGRQIWVVNTFYGILRIILVLGLIKNSIHYSYTLPWLIILLLFPVVGTLMYVIIGRNKIRSQLLKRIIKSEKNSKKYLIQDDAIRLEIDENDALVQNTTYLHKYLQNKDFTNLSRSFILQ